MLLSCAFPVPNVLKQICASSGAAERFAIFRLCEKNVVHTESAFENNLPFLCGRLASISIALADNGRILELLPFSALSVLQLQLWSKNCGRRREIKPKFGGNS
jgi:hypothetical protein